MMPAARTAARGMAGRSLHTHTTPWSPEERRGSRRPATSGRATRPRAVRPGAQRAMKLAQRGLGLAIACERRRHLHDHAREARVERGEEPLEEVGEGGLGRAQAGVLHELARRLHADAELRRHELGPALDRRAPRAPRRRRSRSRRTRTPRRIGPARRPAACRADRRSPPSRGSTTSLPCPTTRSRDAERSRRRRVWTAHGLAGMRSPPVGDDAPVVGARTPGV